jgi:hypothetical protein
LILETVSVDRVRVLPVMVLAVIVDPVRVENEIVEPVSVVVVIEAIPMDDP